MFRIAHSYVKIRAHGCMHDSWRRSIQFAKCLLCVHDGFSCVVEINLFLTKLYWGMNRNWCIINVYIVVSTGMSSIDFALENNSICLLMKFLCVCTMLDFDWWRIRVFRKVINFPVSYAFAVGNVLKCERISQAQHILEQLRIICII